MPRVKVNKNNSNWFLQWRKDKGKKNQKKKFDIFDNVLCLCIVIVFLCETNLSGPRNRKKLSLFCSSCLVKISLLYFFILFSSSFFFLMIQFFVTDPAIYTGLLSYFCCPKILKEIWYILLDLPKTKFQRSIFQFIWPFWNNSNLISLDCFDTVNFND